MTFADEETRLRYHSLPTATQVSYAEWEARLAQRGAGLHVAAVLDVGPRISEVVVRIAEHFDLSARIEPESSDADQPVND